MPSEQTGPIDWFPASLLQDDPEETGDPFALVVLNQPLRDLTTLKRLWNNGACAALKPLRLSARELTCCCAQQRTVQQRTGEQITSTNSEIRCSIARTTQ